MLSLPLSFVLFGSMLVLPALQAQGTPPPVKPNHVLATLTLKPGVERTEILKLLQAEVKATLQLYLDGKIDQWWARGDGKGVVFLMNCSTEAEAQAITGGLPLDKAGLAEFSYMPLGPLMPLQRLLGDAPAQAAK